MVNRFPYIDGVPAACCVPLSVDGASLGSWNVSPLQTSLYEMRQQEIKVVVFIILDWISVLINTTTMIPCRLVL